MVVFTESGSIRAKVVVFLQRWLYSGKMVKFVQTWLNSDKSGFIPAKWFYSAKVVVTGKVVCSGYNGCIQAKRLYSGKSGYIRAGVVVLKEIGCFWAKVVVFGQS